MAQRRVPQSYDEIVRRTVIDPDGSFRPTDAQIAEADERFREARRHAQMTDRERALYQRVATELLGALYPGSIGFEIDHQTVTLHGSVRDVATLARIEERVRALEDVEEVVNQIVVLPSG